MTRIRGWAQKGKRLLGYAPNGHWKTTTFLTAICEDGVLAPLVIDGAANGKIFLAWVQQALIPELKKGDIVVMDNVAFHKTKGIKDAIETVGATLEYLPPYSPDLNPIELFFSKFKNVLRSEEPRTKENLWTKIGQIIDRFSPTELQNYIKHAGYQINQKYQSA
jgi:transposase